MELQEILPAIGNRPMHKFLGGINEDPYLYYEWGERARDFRGGLDRDKARTPIVKNKANRVGAGFGSGDCIVQICDTADFDFDWHFARPTFHEIQGGTMRFLEIQICVPSAVMPRPRAEPFAVPARNSNFPALTATSASG